MRLAFSGLLIFVVVASLDAAPIVEKTLDPGVIVEIPTARQSGNTTILFPAPIAGLYAKSVSAQEQANADFLISFLPGNVYLAVRALKPGVEDHLTVIIDRKAYVFHLTASDEPFYSVSMVRGGGVHDRRRAVNPERLLSLMDTAKAFPLLGKEHPEKLIGVDHVTSDQVIPYDNFRVVIRDVWRFDAEDTLVFSIQLENESDVAILYKPQDLAIGLGDRIYTQSIADASGIMPPNSVTQAFFTITGDGEGGRNNLAPDNDWNVLVVRAESTDANSNGGSK